MARRPAGASFGLFMAAVRHEPVPAAPEHAGEHSDARAHCEWAANPAFVKLTASAMMPTQNATKIGIDARDDDDAASERRVVASAYIDELRRYFDERVLERQLVKLTDVPVVTVPSHAYGTHTLHVVHSPVKSA